jgi:hypothetical protein
LRGERGPVLDHCGWLGDGDGDGDGHRCQRQPGGRRSRVVTGGTGETVGPVADDGNGTYTVAITSSTTPGQDTITATDISVTPSVSASATLTQTAPVVKNLADVKVAVSGPQPRQWRVDVYRNDYGLKRRASGSH